jgi:hypothetical protein
LQNSEVSSIELNSISKFDLFSLSPHFYDFLIFKNWIEGYNWEIVMLTNNIMYKHLSKGFIVYKYLLCCLNALFFVVLIYAKIFNFLELANDKRNGNSWYILSKSILLYVNDSLCFCVEMSETLKVSNLQYFLIYR